MLKFIYRNKKTLNQNIYLESTLSLEKTAINLKQVSSEEKFKGKQKSIENLRPDMK